MSNKKIGIFVGSLRRESFSSSVAKAAVSVAPNSLEFKFINLGDLNMFNQDFDDDGTTPESWITFRKEVAELDGFLFITPEYNRSIPAVLKNALDIGSRPQGQNVWNGKPGGIISVSPGGIGGACSNQQLRQPMAFLNILMLQQPEVYVSNVATLLDDKGVLIDERSLSFLKKYMDTYAAWVRNNSNN